MAEGLSLRLPLKSHSQSRSQGDRGPGLVKGPCVHSVQGPASITIVPDLPVPLRGGWPGGRPSQKLCSYFKFLQLHLMRKVKPGVKMGVTVKSLCCSLLLTQLRLLLRSPPPTGSQMPGRGGLCTLSPWGGAGSSCSAWGRETHGFPFQVSIPAGVLTCFIHSFLFTLLTYPLLPKATISMCFMGSLFSQRVHFYICILN